MACKDLICSAESAANSSSARSSCLVRMLVRRVISPSTDLSHAEVGHVSADNAANLPASSLLIVSIAYNFRFLALLGPLAASAWRAVPRAYSSSMDSAAPGNILAAPPQHQGRFVGDRCGAACGADSVVGPALVSLVEVGELFAHPWEGLYVVVAIGDRVRVRQDLGDRRGLPLLRAHGHAGSLRQHRVRTRC